MPNDQDDSKIILNPPAVPFNYTNRDYRSLKISLVRQVRARVPGWRGYNDPNDFGLALIESFAYAVDGLHYYLDRIANEAYLRTAVRPNSIESISKLFGYSPSPASCASVDLEFIHSGAGGTSDAGRLIPKGTRVQTATVDSVSLAPVYFETTEEGVLPPNPGSAITLAAVEGITVRGDDGYGEVVGLSTGQPWQVFSLPRAPVLNGFVQVYLSYSADWNSQWTQVENIRSGAPASEVFGVEHTPTGMALLLFGSGQSGMIPPSGAAIKCVYRVGGGRRGNVAANTLTVISDDISLVGVGVTNPSGATGGADSESLESIRRNASWLGISNSQHAVSLNDFEKIALSHAHVGKAKATANDPSIVRIAVAPMDDGTLRPGLVETQSGDAAMSVGFTRDTVRSVRRSLRDAAFAGAEIHVEPPQYVQIFTAMTITTAVEAPSTVREAVQKRLQLFASYQYVEFGQKIRAYDLTRIFQGMRGVEDVVVTRLTRVASEHNDISPILLDPDEIPWIDIANDVIFKFVSSDEGGMASGEPRGFTAYTDSAQAPVIF